MYLTSQGKGEMKTYWLKGRTGPIKGIPKKNKIVEAPPTKKEKGRGKGNMDPPLPRMRTVKEESPKAKPPSPKKEPPKPKPKPPSPKKEPPKPKPPSPKKESPPKPKPPSPRKETIKSRSPTPKKDSPKSVSPSPKPVSPTKPMKELSPPGGPPAIKIPDRQAIPTKQVEPITIAVQPAARENRVANAKVSPAKETITGKKVYEDIKGVNPKNGERNGLPSESPVVSSDKMNGSKASMAPMATAGEMPKGKAQSCTCNIL